MKKIVLAIMLCVFISSENNGQTLYGDLIVTPIMAYTIHPAGSNVPTYFLVANGLKANFGFELGFLFPIFTAMEKDARGFMTMGISQHFIGFDYKRDIINLGEQRISNHRHARVFLGVKFIPFESYNFFSLSATVGYGNISANYASKNINGRIKARSTDISISFSVGLNKYVLN